jgi:YbbR domain-containing protein
MKKLFTENLGLKISAVLISFLLWFFITSKGQSEMTVNIPLEFKNVPANMGIVETSAQSVSVTVRGHERLMMNLKPSDIRVYADLSRVAKGEDVFFVNKEDIKLPYALSVRNITPSTVRIKLDETVSKAVPVRPVLIGQPGTGFVLSSVTVEPNKVTVRGLKSDLAKIRSIKTEPLDITGAIKPISQDVDIDTAGANFTPDLDSVRLMIRIIGEN